MHSSFLAAYLGSDPAVANSLSRIASSLRQVDVIDYRRLQPGRSAQILIVDCRQQHRDEHSSAKLSPELLQLALVSENNVHRAVIFASGFYDYLMWPLLEREVLSRLAGCVAEIEGRSGARFFSADPLVQKSCDLLAQRVNQRTALSELARTVGSNRTTLVDRFEVSFGCGPMTWLRHYRMAEAARRLRSGRESVANIAESLGYENSNNFSTAFKAIHGISPLHYRKMALRREKPV
ncbi:hypothetical protein CO660_20000 [Rhizobium sp. L9]|uniref:helix-turn-helix domain-containing protein n=1 Tax=Rhizobium sp. L9 TaxID=1340738 RepID=UPI000BE7D2A1|nr:AraC family transcriptional regulator [Rhizobium sp. L9]PDT27974.1 hypothetical protein CO660_20000 [Rhizobium sp. L9]